MSINEDLRNRKTGVAPANGTKQNIVDEEVWLDFAEGELDIDFGKDLSVLLMNSQADQQQVDTITKLRDLIKGSDEVLLPEDGRVYEELHNRIMAATENMQPGTAVREDQPNTVTFMSRFMRRRNVVGASSFMAIAIAVFATVLVQFGANHRVQAISSVAQAQPNEAAILADSAKNNNSINDEVLAVNAEDEFFADAASQKIASISEQDYARLVADLRN
jgi:hypothetical protein